MGARGSSLAAGMWRGQLRRPGCPAPAKYATAPRTRRRCRRHKGSRDLAGSTSAKALVSSAHLRSVRAGSPEWCGRACRRHVPRQVHLALPASASCEGVAWTCSGNDYLVDLITNPLSRSSISSQVRAVLGHYARRWPALAADDGDAYLVERLAGLQGREGKAIGLRGVIVSAKAGRRRRQPDRRPPANPGVGRTGRAEGGTHKRHAETRRAQWSETPALGRCEVEMDRPVEVLDEATQHANHLIALTP